MSKLTIEQLKRFKESEDKVEFKKAEQGNLLLWQELMIWE